MAAFGGLRIAWEESPDSIEASVPGNARAGKPDGKRHREETAPATGQG